MRQPPSVSQDQPTFRPLNTASPMALRLRQYRCAMEIRSVGGHLHIVTGLVAQDGFDVTVRPVLGLQDV